MTKIIGIPPETRPEEAYKTAFDLTISHHTVNRGDIIVWFTWNRITGQPCMVLTPKGLISHERVIPCVIPITQAWLWDEERGDDDHCLLTGAIFTANLGFNPMNPRNVLKLIGIVRDLLGDLLAMPPMPDEARHVVADAIIIDNATGRETHKEISDHA